MHAIHSCTRRKSVLPILTRRWHPRCPNIPNLDTDEHISNYRTEACTTAIG
jgi:hypothetical protein